MLETNKLSTVVKALFKLDRRTTVELAQLIGMRRNNLVDALGDRRGVPAEYQAKLVEVIGLFNERLNCQQIHYWQVGYEIDDLHVAVSKLFPDGAEVAGLWRVGDSGFDLSRARDRQQYAIFDETALVIVIRKAIGLYAPLAKPISPETLPNLKWKGGSVGSHTMVNVPLDILKSLERAEYQDTNALRVILGHTPKLQWHEVFEYVRQRWSTPESAMDGLMQITHKQQISSDPTQSDQRKHTPKM